MTSSVADAIPDDDPPRPADAGATPARRSPPARAWALTLLASTVAGLASWLLLEALHDRLQPGLLNTPGLPTPAEANAAKVERLTAYTLEAALAFGSLGAALGLGLGAAGGALARSPRRALIGALGGVGLGAPAGALVSGLLTPAFYRWYDPDADTLLLAMAIQGGIGAAVGASAGAAFGIGLGDRGRIPRAVLGGLLGAVLGVLVFQIVAALAFPLDGTSKPMSATWPTRLFGRLAVAVLAAVGALLGAWPWRAASR